MKKKSSLWLVLLAGLSGCTIDVKQQHDMSFLEAKRRAEVISQTNKSDFRDYKLYKSFYQESINYWIFCFEQKGYFMSVGEQYAVFVNATTGHAQLFQGMGYLHPRTEKKLNDQIDAFASRDNRRIQVVTDPL